MRMNNGGCGCGNKGMNGMGRQGMMRMQAEEPYGKRDLKENLEDYKEELEEEIKFIKRRINCSGPRPPHTVGFFKYLLHYLKAVHRLLH